MVSSEEEVEAKTADAVEWDVDMEIQLFYAMANHKPVGINKHFHMACIWEKLSNSITKEISTHDIWRHVESLYDVSMLDDTEPIPFPNQEVPFSLPENEFGILMKQKCKDTTLVEENEATVNRKDSISALSTKTRKESGSSHASTDTPSIKSEKDYDRRRDSRDSNTSGPRDSSVSRKSTTQRDKTKPKVGTAPWESPVIEEDSGRRGRRRTNTSTPPATTPAKRRRT